MQQFLNTNTPVKERDSWRTPEYVFNFANDLLNGIDFDSACTVENALSVPIWRDETHRDALLSEWTGKIWCNPPYSNIKPWIDKAIQSKAKVAMLIPSPNGESYFEPLLNYSHEIAIIGRLAFIDHDGKERTGNNRGSSIFLINCGNEMRRSFVKRDELKAKYGR